MKEKRKSDPAMCSAVLSARIADAIEGKRSFKLKPAVEKALDHWCKRFSIPHDQFVNQAITLLQNAMDDPGMVDWARDRRDSLRTITEMKGDVAP